MLSMTACGKAETKTETGAETKAETSKEQAGDAAEGEKQKVVFWSWQPTDKQIAELEPAFEAAYPNIDLEYWRGDIDEVK